MLSEEHRLMIQGVIELTETAEVEIAKINRRRVTERSISGRVYFEKLQNDLKVNLYALRLSLNAIIMMEDAILTATTQHEKERFEIKLINFGRFHNGNVNNISEAIHNARRMTAPML